MQRSHIESVRKLRSILSIWLKVMNHTRIRDRSVKILQYGSQFLLAYWGAGISQSMRKQLTMLQLSSSTSRKAFWILKSFDNLSTALTQLEEGYFSYESSIIEKLDAFENLCIMWYYWCETKIFFARSNLFNLSENLLETPTNLSWVLGDVAYFLSSLLRLRENTAQLRDLEDQIQRREASCADAADEAITSSLSLEHEYESTFRSNKRLKNKFIISVLELAVSAQYSGLIKWLSSDSIRLGNKYIGLIGVCSSVLIIRESVLDSMEIEEEEEMERAQCVLQREIRGR